MNPASSNTSSADPEIQRQYAERQATQQRLPAQGPRMVQGNWQQQEAVRDEMDIDTGEDGERASKHEQEEADELLAGEGRDVKKSRLEPPLEAGPDLRVVVRGDATVVALSSEKLTVPVTREALNNAIRSNDLETIGHLLKTGKIDLNVIDEIHDLPLVVAARCGNADVVRLLLEVDANVHAGTKWCETALIVAVEGGHAHVFALLIEAGADIHDVGNEGETVLMRAATGGSVVIVEQLLSLGADVHAVNKGNSTLLIVAADYGHADVFARLLKAGADIPVAGTTLKRMQFAAARGGNVAIMKELFSLGIDIDATKLGWTMLMVAANAGNTDMVKFLIEKNAVIDIADKFSGTALMVAASSGRADIFEILLEKNRTSDVKNFFGCTALMYAAHGGSLKIVEKLLSLGADVNTVCGLGTTALMFAAENGQTGVFTLLLEKNAAIDVVSKYGKTVLMSAVEGGSLKIVEKLLSLGADVHAADHEGKTPLTIALKHGRADVFASLVKTGIDINVVVGGEPLLIKAIQGGSVEIVKQLLDLNAKVDATGTLGKTALLWATLSGNLTLSELLLKHGANPNVRSTGKSSSSLTVSTIKKADIPVLELLLAYGGESNDLKRKPSPLVNDLLQHRALLKPNVVATSQTLESLYGTSLSLLPEVSADSSVRKSLAQIFTGLQICSPIIGRMNEQLGYQPDDQVDKMSYFQPVEIPYAHSVETSDEMSDDQVDDVSDDQVDDVSDDQVDDVPAEQADAPDKLMQALADTGNPPSQAQKSMAIAGLLTSLEGWVASWPNGWTPYKRKGLSAQGEAKLTALVQLQAKKLAALGEQAEMKLAIALETLLPQCAQYTQVKNGELVVDEAGLMAHLTDQLGLYDPLAYQVAAAWFTTVNQQQPIIRASSLFQSAFDEQASESAAGQVLLAAFGRALKQIDGVEAGSLLQTSTLQGQQAGLYTDLMFRQLHMLMQYADQASAAS